LSNAAQSPEIMIEKISHEGRGIGYLDGRVVFVEGALVGETVKINIFKKTPKFAEARVSEVLKASPERVVPKCAVFGTCGGCSLQHMPSSLQITLKQQMLAEQFKHFAGTEPEVWLSPLQTKTFGYRSKARLGVKDVAKKGGVLIGFREKNGKSLKKFIESLSIRNQIPQLECAVDDSSAVLIIRHMVEFSPEDLEKIKAFVDEFSKISEEKFNQKLVIYLQSKGPETIKRLYPEGPELLSYELENLNLKFFFAPSDFTQVNMSLNPLMIDQALKFLEIKSTDIVLDLFCGLGNFTLPLAQKAKHVVGVEGDAAMTTRALSNAAHNKINNVEFYAENLFEPFAGKAFFAKNKYDKVLLDPPRAGALQACTELANLGKKGPEKIVYVSCNPATLARDSGVLVSGGYRLTHAGVMDMFPHTEHVESMAVFSR
jgi:23S rRNA (uracil1939-C5)-methyltransferase